MSFGLKKVFSQHGGRIVEKWIFDAKSPLLCGATPIEFEGKALLVIGTKDGMILCIDEEGKQVWSYNTQEKLGNVESYFVDEERVHSIDAPPVIADFDGTQAVLVGNERGMLHCISMRGELLWNYNCGGSLKASVLVADINMDGLPEIIVGSTNNKLIALNRKGKLLFEHISDAPIESTPGLLRGKKFLIVFGNNNGKLTAITPAQDVAWKADLQHKITAAPSFFNDGEQRIVVGTVGGTLYCITERGELTWQFQTQGSIYSAASVADINDDKQPEILFGSCDNNVYALTNTGRRIWSYETDFWITGTPLITDIDDDGKLEVVCGSYDHSVYILDSQGTYVLDYVPGLSPLVTQAGHYSNIITSDVGQQTGKKLYQFRTEGIIVGCTLFQRKDAKPALVINIKSGKINKLGHEE
jgi:outer membrane protein assembly factor BamB